MVSTNINKNSSLNEAPRVYLLDDHPVFVKGLRLMLERQEAFEFVGSSHTVSQAVEELSSNIADILIADILMPGEVGITHLQSIRKQFPDLKILVLSQSEDEQTLDELIHLPVQGFVLKSDCFSEVERALVALKEKKSYFSPLVTGILCNLLRTRPVRSGSISKRSTPLVSERERQIALLVAKGKTNREIGSELGCSEFTVKSHKANLMRKIGARNSVELTNWIKKN